jgi:hypothetical protein
VGLAWGNTAERRQSLNPPFKESAKIDNHAKNRCRRKAESD